MRLADFIAAGGVSWRGAAWQQVAKNFLAELSKALAWDGVSDPRQRGPSARAPTEPPPEKLPIHRPIPETEAQRRMRALREERAYATAAETKPQEP